VHGACARGNGVSWELFTGIARWSQASSDVGWAYLAPFDLNRSSRRDLTNMFVVEKVLRVGKSGWVQLARSGASCGSFSEAITLAWRAAEYPVGLPSLSGAAALKVAEGDAITSHARIISNAFDAWASGVSDENPWGSWRWYHPDIVNLNDTALKYVR
jgi:hypothetical protein